jgi:hypothetical protein
VKLKKPTVMLDSSTVVAGSSFNGRGGETTPVALQYGTKEG